jgi:hypothetical protein
VEWNFSSTRFLSWAVNGGEWSTSRTTALPSGKESPIQWMEGWLGLRAGPDAAKKTE